MLPSIRRGRKDLQLIIMKLLVLISFFLTSVTGIAQPCCCDDTSDSVAKPGHEHCNEADEKDESDVHFSGDNHSAEHKPLHCAKTCCAMVVIESKFSFVKATNILFVAANEMTIPSNLPPGLSVPPPRA